MPPYTTSMSGLCAKAHATALSHWGCMALSSSRYAIRIALAEASARLRAAQTPPGGTRTLCR